MAAHRRPSAKLTSTSPPPPARVTRRDSRGRRFVPGDHGVGARRHVVEPVSALVVGDGEVAVREDEDERAHVRVDVAEHAHDAGTIELDRLRAADGVAPEVERLGGREREHVVVGASLLGKSTVVPATIARTCGTNASLRWSSLARGSSRWSNAALRRGLEIDDAAAAVGRVVRASASRRRRTWGRGARSAGDCRSSTRPRIVPFTATLAMALPVDAGMLAVAASSARARETAGSGWHPGWHQNQ